MVTLPAYLHVGVGETNMSLSITHGFLLYLDSLQLILVFCPIHTIPQAIQILSILQQRC